MSLLKHKNNTPRRERERGDRQTDRQTETKRQTQCVWGGGGGGEEGAGGECMYVCNRECIEKEKKKKREKKKKYRLVELLPAADRHLC